MEEFDIETLEEDSEDFADFDVEDDIDFGYFSIDEESEHPKTRYMTPHIAQASSICVRYRFAEELAKALRVAEGMRADAIVDGTFIFGDFIEAFVTMHNVFCEKMIISTLSLSQNNVDSLVNLIRGGYIGELQLIVSAYFYSHERHNLIPYIYEQLDNGLFQLAVARVHTKTCQILTKGGKKIVMHGSANMRSSQNIEQFTIEENKPLYDFYEAYFEELLDKHKTINYGIRK